MQFNYSDLTKNTCLLISHFCIFAILFYFWFMYYRRL